MLPGRPRLICQPRVPLVFDLEVPREFPGEAGEATWDVAIYLSGNVHVLEGGRAGRTEQAFHFARGLGGATVVLLARKRHKIEEVADQHETGIVVSNGICPPHFYVQPP